MDFVNGHNGHICLSHLVINIGEDAQFLNLPVLLRRKILPHAVGHIAVVRIWGLRNTTIQARIHRQSIALAASQPSCSTHLWHEVKAAIFSALPHLPNGFEDVRRLQSYVLHSRALVLLKVHLYLRLALCTMRRFIHRKQHELIVRRRHYAALKKNDERVQNGYA